MITGIEHVGLSVKNVEATVAFLIEVFGFREVGRKPDYPAIFVRKDSLRLTLWQIESSEQIKPFDRRQNVGLHHLAFKVDSSEDLDRFYAKLIKIKEVKIEFAPELLGKGPSRHMMFYEPGGLRLELICRS